MLTEDQKTYDLNLSKVLKGKSPGVNIQTNIAKLDEDTWACFLVTVNIKGVPIAEGLEIELDPDNQTFKGDLTWKLSESPHDIVVSEEDDENEVTIHIEEMVFKTKENGESSAMSVFNTDGKGENSVATANWQ